MGKKALTEQAQAIFDVIEDAHCPHQACTRPLTIIEPDVGETTNIRHDGQTQVNDKATDGTGDKVLFQVCQRSKEAVEMTSTKVIEDTDQANLGTWGDIANKPGDKDTMIGHEIIARIVVDVSSSSYITCERIAIIFNLKGTILFFEVGREPLQE